MDHDISLPPLVWVERDNCLSKAIKKWKKRTWICIDTEFIRQSTYYPKPALLQVYDGEKIYLIDPLAIRHWQPLAELLCLPSLLKIMHAPQEDMDVLRLLTNQVPSPIFDTQIAAAFCNFDSPCSYQLLVEKLLHVNVDKKATRSNWMDRPLSDIQISYASLDVYYLPAIYNQLKTLLHGSQKWSWLEQECQLLVKQCQYEKDPENAWLEFKLNQPLCSEEQKILKALCAWRESYIRKHDIPRRKVPNNEQILRMVLQQPVKLYTLQRKLGFSPMFIKEFGEEIIAVIETAKQQENPKEFIQPRARPTPKERTFIKEMQKACLKTCEALDIHSSLLPGKKYAMAMIRENFPAKYFMPSEMTGWRKPFLKNIMDEVTQNK